MRFPSAKVTALSVVSMAAFACASVATQADACCGFFAALFGCGGCSTSCCRPACAPCSPCGSSPCGPAGCPTTTYYGPVVYGSGCSTCDSPCATGNCATGNCAVSSTVGNSSAPPDADPKFTPKKSGAPKTYRDDDNSRTGNEPANGDGASRQLNQSDNVSLQKNSGEEDATGAGDSPKTKKSPAVPKADGGEDGANGSRRGPTIINLDDKVAWRSAPTRTRVGVKPSTATARLVRLPSFPKTEWQPVESEEKVAKK
ncbi:MAG: hypothetical protein JSS02_07585 [Planctomycetes bacterium]|nr:hypothetical protein [Planctomycetota bacterium]